MNIPEIKNNTINIDSIKDQKRPANINTNSDVLKPIKGSTIDSISHTAKELVTDLIPIYGTIHAFKQGKIGWGIFGIVTDILTIIPALGLGIKLAGSLAKKGNFAIQASKASIKAQNIASSIIKESNVATKIEYIPANITKESKVTTKIKTVNEEIKETGRVNAINAETIHIENSETINIEKNTNTTETSNIAKKFAKSLAHTTDTRLTSLYKEGKVLYKQGEKIGDQMAKKLDINTTNILPHAVKSAPSKYLGKALNTVKKSKWHPADFSTSERITLNESMDIMFKRFKELDKLKLDEQFIKDVGRASYEINGKLGTVKNPEKTMKLITEILSKDPKKAQLISAFANQTVFSDPYSHLRRVIKDLFVYSSKNNKIIYKIDTMDKDTVKITAKFESDLIKTKEPEILKGCTKGVNFKKYGLKMELILSTEKVIESKPYVYIK